jgi:phosphoribosylaminoimidazolecarboxamide formyltransferase/IMP cyclohydrolase
MQIPIKKAILSVYDKTGLLPLCQALKKWGVELYATQGTTKFLKENGQIESLAIESVTQFPEMMDGRVKTLHPRIFGGVLARRNQPSDLEDAKKHGVPLFDLIVGNLYPFQDHLGETPEQQAAFIDIGGPSLLRAASKNHAAVTVVSDPGDYDALIEELERNKGTTTLGFRKSMAAKTFLKTSQYDALIASEWQSETSFGGNLAFPAMTPLRYGENPHQKAAFAALTDWKILQGKELSYNNLLDAEAATGLVADFTLPSCAIIKHNNPCTVASFEGGTSEVFSTALKSDEKSSFGGIVAVNRPVDGIAAEKMAQIFLEVVIAPTFTPEALTLFSQKKNLRLIEWTRKKEINPSFEVRRAMGGWLLQSLDNSSQESWKIVTKASVSDALKKDLEFAWTVVKHVRSNAIVIAEKGVAIGIGGGQTSRVDAVEIALKRSEGKRGRNCVLASDAFFPFRDNIDLLKDKNIAAIIQPGGSQRDTEVIEACNELGIAMVFTGVRHFRH